MKAEVFSGLQLYKNIRNRRIELNMTQSDLAEKMGYADKSMIAKIEKGQIDLQQSKLELFAKALDTTCIALMENSHEDLLENTKKGNQEDYLERMKEQKKLSQEIINLFKEKEVTYELAINVLKDTLYRLERMSLKQKL